MTLRALCIATVLGAGQIPAGPAIAQSPLPAPQPSFDCAKAGDRIGQIICSDAELARWDARMGQAYRQRFTALGANERGALLEDQRRWLASRGTQCSQADTSAAKGCILQFTKTRLAALEQKDDPIKLPSPPLKTPQGADAGGARPRSIKEASTSELSVMASNLSPNEVVELCQSSDAEKRLLGCTAIINAKGRGYKITIADALDGRCWAYNVFEQYERAVEDCKASISINPRYSYAYNNLGTALFALGQLEKAIDAFTKSINLKANFIYPYLGRARAFVASGEKELARKDYEYALVIDPKNQQANDGIVALAPIATEPFEDGLAAYDRGDYATAMRVWLPHAAQGNAYAQFFLGRMYYNGRGVAPNYAAAVSWYRKAADQGLADAQVNLGVMYDLGRGVPQDHAAAARWYRKAADQGDKIPQAHLGLMYGEGRGVPQDYAAAVSWYRKAANQGYANAQLGLGHMYEKGEGVPQDYAAAVSWYRKAADQGHASAQFYLADMYETGRGVPQDYISAHMWFNLAAAGGIKGAQIGRDEIVAPKMTPAQIAEAQKRAAEWRPKVANVAPGDAGPAIPSAKKSNPERFFGTAFFVSMDGKVLTNAHVVEQCTQVRVTAAGQESAARIVARDDKDDLALLATAVKPLQPASWRLSVRQGEDIVVYGFPLAGVLAAGGNVAAGNVTALAGLGNDSRFLQISAPVQPGNSGGPLLDRNGNVVGVVVSKLNALNVASVTGDIPQNVNFAIKASVAAAFLDAQHVAHTEGAGAAALSTPDIAERANALTMQVICIR